jgi:23S rRNA pseudouridine2605 synthase
MSNPEDRLRLNRFLARAGFGSRRSAEELVRQGKVSINGQTVHDLGRQVDPGTDEVQVDGQPALIPSDFRVYAFHKPVDVVSTLKAQDSQPALLAYRVRADLPDRFVPVGRLDSESSGLLLWTDDGQLNQVLCRPDSGVWKTYEVELNGPLIPNQREQLISGKIQLDGRACRPSRLEMQPDETNRHWIMQIHEGHRRQIRRMFHAIGLKVLVLHRTDVGPVNIGRLRPGDYRRLNPREVVELRQAAGSKKR